MMQKLPTAAQQTIVVIEDHEMPAIGLISTLKQSYPEADIRLAQTSHAGQELVANVHPDLVVVDLMIPDHPGNTPLGETGVNLLKVLMKHYPTLNIAILSSNVNPLVRVKTQIDNHEGGFTVSDKKLKSEDFIKRINMALEGGRYLPREMKLGLEIKPEWLKLLQLAFQEGLEDKEIAKRMRISDSTVRNYFTKVQDALDVRQFKSEVHQGLIY